MNYQLHENEKIELEIKPSQRSIWYFVFASMGRFLHLIIMVVLIIIMTFISSYLHHRDQVDWSFFRLIAEQVGLKTETIMMVSLGLLILIFLGLYGLSKLVVNAYTYTVTNQRVEVRVQGMSGT
jgi:hypothetical protein